eukprot:ctg_1158.g344
MTPARWAWGVQARPFVKPVDGKWNGRGVLGRRRAWDEPVRWRARQVGRPIGARSTRALWEILTAAQCARPLIGAEAMTRELRRPSEPAGAASNAACAARATPATSATAADGARHARRLALSGAHSQLERRRRAHRFGIRGRGHAASFSTAQPAFDRPHSLSLQAEHRILLRAIPRSATTAADGCGRRQKAGFLSVWPVRGVGRVVADVPDGTPEPA